MPSSRRPLWVLLDTTAVNWFADHNTDLQVIRDAVAARVVQIVLTPEAAKEIKDTTNPARLAELEGVLAAFFPSSLRTAAHECDWFVTRDREISRSKGSRVVEPRRFCEKLDALLSS